MSANPQPTPTAAMSPAERATIAMLRINDLINALAKDAAAMVKKRADARYPISCPVRVGSLHHDGKFKVLSAGWALDISNQGLGFLSELPYLNGRTLDLIIDFQEMQALEAPIRVLHCQQVLTNTFRIGAIFAFDD